MDLKAEAGARQSGNRQQADQAAPKQPRLPGGFIGVPGKGHHPVIVHGLDSGFHKGFSFFDSCRRGCRFHACPLGFMPREGCFRRGKPCFFSFGDKIRDKSRVFPQGPEGIPIFRILQDIPGAVKGPGHPSAPGDSIFIHNFCISEYLPPVDPMHISCVYSNIPRVNESFYAIFIIRGRIIPPMLYKKSY